MKSHLVSRLFGIAAIALLAASGAVAAASTSEGTFLDDNHSVHQGNIEAIAASGVTRGCNPPMNDRFCPDRTVSRGQMAAFIARALQLPEPAHDFFRDDSHSVFEHDIDRMAEAGITKGCNPPANDRFCPDRFLTRAEMAAFLVRAFNVGESEQDLFDDDDHSVFEAEINRLGAAGIAKGCDPPANRSFCPDRSVSRGEMASFLARALGLEPISLPPPAPDPTPPGGNLPPESTIPPAPGKSRDPLKWPYPYDSIWNYPLGESARLVDLELELPKERTLNVEEDIIIIRPDSTPRWIKESNAGWTGALRCDPGTWTGANLKDSFPVPLPTGWRTDPGYWGNRPNHSAAIVLPDFTLFETQPFHICPDGTAVSRHHNVTWRGDSIRTGGYGPRRGGSHGGSGMSAFGGTIRLGEWVPGGEIPHTIKMLVDSRATLSTANGGYRWPALNADSGYQGYYGGSVPAARMGALIALPPSFDVEALESEAARILGRALQRYGAYIVDGTGWSVVSFATEWGPDGRVLDEFQSEWGFPLAGHRPNSSGQQRIFLTDMERIYRFLHVVDDNSQATLGGAGKRMAPWAPPFHDGTGGPP